MLGIAKQCLPDVNGWYAVVRAYSFAPFADLLDLQLFLAPPPEESFPSAWSAQSAPLDRKEV
jgi:hypothetical protein